jgi:hypothetical protein
MDLCGNALNATLLSSFEAKPVAVGMAKTSQGRVANIVAFIVAITTTVN